MGDSRGSSRYRPQESKMNQSLDAKIIDVRRRFGYRRIHDLP